MFKLKPISRDSIETALAQAERYRLLNEPPEAESICHDILAVDPANRDARVSLVLALTDEIHSDSAPFAPHHRGHPRARIPLRPRLLLRNRMGAPRKGRLSKPMDPVPANYIYDWIVKALQFFEEAEHLRPSGNDDAILRWNTCVRFLDAQSSYAQRWKKPQSLFFRSNRHIQCDKCLSNSSHRM